MIVERRGGMQLAIRILERGKGESGGGDWKIRKVEPPIRKG
jgi:hypothetical protein